MPKSRHRETGGSVPTCKECSSFFPLDENPQKGDCVRRVVDPRQGYYTAKPELAEQDASKCPSFQKRPQAVAGSA